MDTCNNPTRKRMWKKKTAPCKSMREVLSFNLCLELISQPGHILMSIRSPKRRIIKLLCVLCRHRPSALCFSVQNTHSILSDQLTSQIKPCVCILILKLLLGRPLKDIWTYYRNKTVSEVGTLCKAFVPFVTSHRCNTQNLLLRHYHSKVRASSSSSVG